MEIKVKQRISLSIFFFLSGLCFSSWASRIPSIKAYFELNEAELGTLLFAMPISSLLGLPISGWLVEKYDSRWPLVIAFVFHGAFLLLIGVSVTVTFFTISIFLFAFTNRITNISMNTQAITLSKLFVKKINGSFHGLWSFGGIVGVGFTTLMISMGVEIEVHYMFVAGLTLLLVIFAFPNLLKEDKSKRSNKLVVKKPDSYIITLGLIILCAALCEGGMFDWSGIYFKEVVNVEIFTIGYLTFMGSMAFSRFISDWAIQKLGMPKLFIVSSVLMTIGLTMAVVFPYFWPALIGFLIVGAGTAAVVPMVFVLAGGSTKFTPGVAISIISTFGLVGFLTGPPLIGYIAHALNLQASFMFLAVVGLCIIPISIRFFKKLNVQPNISTLEGGEDNLM